MMEEKRVVLAEYFVTPDKTVLFIVHNDFNEPQIIEINVSSKEIRQSVNAQFGPTRYGSMASNLNLDEWQTRFAPFVAPLLSWTIEGDIIWFALHDMLHYLPFHALKVDGRYLIERNPVCYTPSASVMRFCHAKRKNSRTRALVVGDSLGDLLYARAEALAVAQLFETTPYLQGQATKRLVREKLAHEREQLDILHFSCHGYFSFQQALRSGIALAPETESAAQDEHWNLTAEEIFHLSMRANLVTLSACDTGVNEHKPGDELIGLTRALIYAGTPSVVVSLWAMEDISTSLLMQNFYQQLRTPAGDEPITKAEALQSAQKYVKGLTAEHVVEYCNQRLAELGPSEDAELAFGFHKGLADVQTLAGDLLQAVINYRACLNYLQMLDRDWARKLQGPLRKRLRVAELKARRGQTSDYNLHPFEHLYYWAPFVLVGDWQ